MSRWRRIAAVLGWCFSAACGRAAINISCVGDSITAGVGVTSPLVDSYPARLQWLLGTNYPVWNWGDSGKTLLKQGDMPYWGTLNYTLSHNHPTPNIVIIMLGTNDSKPQNWVYGSNFVANCVELIGTYTNLSTKPRILLCTPPPVFNNGFAGINPGIVETNISVLIRQVGTNQNLQVIDMNALLAGHNEWFPDNVHPNSRGTAVMAAIVYRAIVGDTMNGAVPDPTISRHTVNTTLIRWPAAGAGWVLQSAPGLGGTNVWTVATQRPVTDGNFMRVTNTISGSRQLFRLWSPPN
jgi:acyl-CoA thioesterase I